MTTIRLKWPLLIVLGMILTAVLFGGRISPQTAEPAPTAPAPASTAPGDHGVPEYPQHEHPDHQHAPGEREGAHSEDPSPVQTPDYHAGHDEDFAYSDLEQNAALTATTEFISAWLIPDAHHRVQLLEPVAAAALTEGLADPHTRIWQTTPDGPPTLQASSSQAVTTRQTMTDGRAVELLLHYEPDTKHGWIVTDIAPSSGSQST